MESWRKVFRDAVARVLTLPQLQALETALASNDPRLIQGGTTTPPPLLVVQDWPVEAACALTLAGWQGDGLVTVAECEEFFARICFEIDQIVNEPAACRWFLSWFDDTPRDEMIRELLPEVRLAIAARTTPAVA